MIENMRNKYKKVYEELQNGELDKKLENLQNKVNERTATQEEIKEIRKLEAIKNNGPKIENVIEMQKIFEEEAKRIEEEIQRRGSNSKNDKKKLEDQVKKLDAEVEKLTKKEEDLIQKLKTNLSEEEKAKTKQELKSTRNEIGENNIKFAKAKEDLSKMEEKENEPKEQSRYDGMSNAKLNARYNNVKNKSAKCDLALACLLKGKSWDAIEKRLDGFEERKFSAKEGLKKRLEAERAARKEEQNKNENIEQKPIEEKLEEKIIKQTTKAIEEQENNNQVMDGNYKNVNETTELVEKSEFAQKHPRIAKILNFIKNMPKKIAEKFSLESKEIAKEDVEEIEEQLEQNEQEQEKGTKAVDKNKYYEREAEELITSTGKKFRNQYKVILEEGIDKAVESREKNARERYEELHKKAQDPNRYEIDANGVKHDNFER